MQQTATSTATHAATHCNKYVGHDNRNTDIKEVSVYIFSYVHVYICIYTYVLYMYVTYV